MKKLWLISAIIFALFQLNAQNNFVAFIKDKDSKEALIGATAIIKGATNGAVSDAQGRIEIQNVPTGKQIFICRYIGYTEQQTEIDIPIKDSIEILLTRNAEELDDIIIESTRGTRTIANEPTRVETIGLEEIEEKNNMRPANVSMMLHESTGIQVQQTSATSGNASIKIQGLDGKYTQLLKDGYPNFGGFSSGLSILEIPPLDLKQVEVIKGPASTLYGAGAIAGVFNFISKTPGDKPETLILVNQSHVLQTNIGAFTAQKYKTYGFTLLALANFQKPYDVDKDDFTELPKAMDFSIHPNFFIYPDKNTTITLGNFSNMGERTGGDIFAVEGHADSLHTYFEKNTSFRNISTFDLNRKIGINNSFTAKTSFSYFNRRIELPNYTFGGQQYNSYSEASYVHTISNHTILAGANFIYDRFTEDQLSSALQRSQTTITGGIFVQHTWDASQLFSLESGLRFDNANYTLTSNSKNEFFVLPRISGLFKWSQHFSSRIGGGLGYKTPSMFTEQTETLDYRNVSGLSQVKSERSYGGTADITYKTAFAKNWYFNVNAMFFYTNIQSPLVLQQNSSTDYYFASQLKPIQSLGTEINLKLSWKDLKLFSGYTYTDARAYYQTGNTTLPLIPAHRINLSLVYENPKIIKIGLEAYYSSNQYLRDGTHSSPYWEFGAMAEKTFKHISIFVNAENFTDTRQNKFAPVVQGPHNNPTFADIWTHTEGFVFNGGVKIKL